MDRAGHLITIMALTVGVLGTTCYRSLAQPAPTADRVKFWISFTDKNRGEGRGPLPVEPDRISPRAQERRARRGRSVGQGLDAPVSPYYVGRLRGLGIEPIVTSRWLNAISAYLSPEQSEQVGRLDFVKSVTPVARSVGVDARTEAAETSQMRNRLPSAVHSPRATTIDYGSSLAQLQAINAVDPIEAGFIGEGLLMGFLDTRTDTLHSSLVHLADSGQIVATRDFTVEDGLTAQSNKHGLSVSSTAMGFDEGDLVGPCYGAEYIFATTEYAPFERNQEEDYYVAGIEWLESMGADIVNVSLGYTTFDPGQDSYTYTDMDGNTAKTTIASDLAVGFGVIVVASAGNSGCSNPANCWYYIGSPADGDSVIAVGAVDLLDNRTSFSSRGPTYDGRIKPDVAALGSGVRVASSSGGYRSSNGTSFSSPLVAGVACQILQANPDLNPIQVRTLLRSTGSQSDNPDNNLGWGVINAAEAVRLAQVADTTAPVLDDFVFVPDTVDVTVVDTSVVFRVWASDSVAGVRHVQLCLSDPLGADHCSLAASPDSGNAWSGRWSLSIPITGMSETGTWVVSKLAIQDSVVSITEFDSTALATAGYPTDVEVVVRLELQTTVLLEGPYVGGDSMLVGVVYTSSVPLTQPFDSTIYAGTPLFHDGSEQIQSVPAGMIDWVLLSLRADTSAASTVQSATQAAILMADGAVVDTAGKLPVFYNTDSLSYYVVIRTRNHGSIMTASPVDFTSGQGSWDFSSSAGSAFSSGGIALKMLETGTYGLFACDINHDGQITALDFNAWLPATKAVATGYLNEDCNLDGQVTAADFNLWLPNTKAVVTSQVPE
jgi:hypothetical protein